MKKLFIFALAAVVMAGCKNFKSRRYVVVHHGNIHDTVTTSSFIHYTDRKTADMQEGGSFSQVEYIKAIE